MFFELLNKEFNDLNVVNIPRNEIKRLKIKKSWSRNWDDFVGCSILDKKIRYHFGNSVESVETFMHEERELDTWIDIKPHKYSHLSLFIECGETYQDYLDFLTHPQIWKPIKSKQIFLIHPTLIELNSKFTIAEYYFTPDGIKFVSKYNNHVCSFFVYNFVNHTVLPMDKWTESFYLIDIIEEKAQQLLQLTLEKYIECLCVDVIELITKFIFNKPNGKFY